MSAAVVVPPPSSTAWAFRGESFVMKSGRRTTLKKGSKLVIEPSAKSRKKKTIRFPRDDFEFYPNIWGEPEDFGDNAQKFIDIAHVAHVVTTSDYKSDYDQPHPAIILNVWASDLGDDKLEKESSTSSTKTSSEESSGAALLEALMAQTSMTQSTAPPAKLRTLNQLLELRSMLDIPVAPPSKINKDTVMFSVVLSPADVCKTWSAKFLLGLHEPIRHALYVIDRFLDRSQDKESPVDWNASAFFTWFKQSFVPFVRAQHSIKVTVLRPLLQIKYAVKREIVDSYEEMAFMIEAIIAQESIVSRDTASTTKPWHQRLATLQGDIRKLNLLLHHALDIEESVLQPKLSATFNEDAFNTFVMPRVFRAAHPKRIVIPWIVERSIIWGGPEEAAKVKKQLSIASRFLYDRVWHPHFVRHVAGAMKILDSTMTNMPAESHEPWFACCIQ
ncbi:hypothetical protein Poli38472_000652 [Pythium oligandrum]|uniref:Uncharacterized protein n=1 Tax=Pythium oligandrum TaxID=41045 RepID=A0A8K1CCI3_PYTOL|nr:hypothetical protein Poli38472_000652 [Pythium oligandrum]|eukprot:TMW60610.1 hypothetical protein Poli38472_000652 [Pythium oligandrum]